MKTIRNVINRINELNSNIRKLSPSLKNKTFFIWDDEIREIAKELDVVLSQDEVTLVSRIIRG